MELLVTLRNAGLRLRADAGRLLVEPRAALTEATRATIRINKRAILRELDVEVATWRNAMAAAAEQAGLDDWRAPLLQGTLHLCGNCRHLRCDIDPAGRCHCGLHGEGLMPFLPFHCPDFEVSTEPAAPDYLPRNFASVRDDDSPGAT
jgi:hypothetical protein